MRNRFSETLFELAKRDERIYVVVADISPAGPMSEFRDKYPDRFINVGVAEQSMIGVSAGLALQGALPFTYTIATFSLYRPFEFIRDDLAYQQLPVTVVGIGGGLIYSTLGATHYAQEDISVASAIPGLNVLAPTTPDEVTEILHSIVNGHIKGPSYLRLGKTGESNFRYHDEFVFKKPRVLIKSNSSICLISYGVIANKLFVKLREHDKLANHVDFITFPTVKPLDSESIEEILRRYQLVIVIEENSVVGSLGEHLKARAYENKLKVSIEHYSLKDEFIHCYGSHEEIMRKHGLDLDIIIHRLSEILKTS